MTPPHLLILEDDPFIAEGLLYALEKAGYQTSHATTLAQAKSLITNNSTPFALALLDMHLPDGQGTALAPLLPHTAIIYLTVVDDENTIVKALDAGAADYVTKPFRIGELLARVARRVDRTPAGLAIGPISIDQEKGKVTNNGQPVDLTALEYRLLLIFATHRGQLLTRRQILEKIWDSAGSFVEDNTLTVYVKRLREKLGVAFPLETVRGMGYRVD